MNLIIWKKEWELHDKQANEKITHFPTSLNYNPFIFYYL